MQNIFSRVTGGNISNIDGSIKANGVANLFLINPNGIIFGPNARLNIGGSFLASTANSLLFDGGIEFSATNTSAPPLLAINIPIGLQFRGITGEIRLQQSKLQQFQPGRTFAFVGGNTTLESGNLVAAGGRVELGGLAATGTIGLNVDGNLLQLNFPDSVTRSDVSITNKASIDVRPGNSGSIAINAQNLNIFGESSLVAGISSGLGGVGVRGGDITLNATEAVSIGQSSRIRNDLGSNATGQNGDIIITAGSLSLTDKAFITNSSFGQGNAGNVRINVRDNVSLTGDNTSIFGSTAIGTVGNAGNIEIQSGSLLLNNGALIASDTFSQGNAGNVTINVREKVSLGNDTRISSTVASQAVGNGGEINIRAGSVSLSNGAEIITSLLGRGSAGNILINTSDSVSVSGGALLQSDTFGQGNGGKVTIQSDGIVSFDGVGVNDTPSGVTTKVATQAVGNGGEINIQAVSLSLTNGSQLKGTTFGIGNAGSVSVQAEDSVSLENSFVLSNVEAEAIGKGGNISIQSGSLSLSDGAELVTSTLGHGDAGSVTIKASGTVSFNGVSKSGLTTGIFSTIEAGAKGNGGDISIQSGELSLTIGATLSTTTAGQGNSGSIEIQAQQLLLSNGSQMLTATSGQGDAGNILVQANDLISLIGSSTGIYSSISPGGIGNGGNINIKTNITTGSLLVSNEAVINASTYGEGNGGSINVTTGSLSLADKAQVFASTFGQGNAGNVIIDAKNTATFSGLNTAIASTVESGAVGNGGNITLTARSLSVTNGAALTASTYGEGNAGNVTIQVDDAIFLDGNGGDQLTNPSGASSTVNSGAIGNGGNVTVTTGSLSMTNGAVLLATTFGNGNAGNVNVKANHEVSLDRSLIGSAVVFGAVGNGGNVTIAAKSVSLLNGAGIGVSTFGNGNSGSVFLQAEDSISLSGDTAISSTVEAGAIGNSSGIEMKAGSIFITSGAQLRSSTDGKGNAGNVTIIARDTFSIDGVGNTEESSGIFSTVKAGGEGRGGDVNITTGSLLVSNEAVINASTYGKGNAGSISVTTGSLSLTDGAQLFTNTFGQGKAGNVIIDAQNTATFSGLNTGIGSRSESGAVGNGGNITLTARSLSVTNGAGLTANTYGEGNAGNVTIQVDDSIFLDGNGGDPFNNPSGASSTVNSGAIGNGGNVTVKTGSLSMTNSAVLLATTFGNGNAGNVNVQANNEVSLDRSFINSAVIFGAVGNGGNITIAAKSVSLLNGAGIGVSTFGNGNSGNVFLQAEDSISLSGDSTRIRSTVDSGVIGNGGNIEIKTGSLSLSDGALFSTSTFGQGNAGSVFVQAEGSVLLSGNSTAIFTTVEAGAVGNGGDINIKANSFSLTNGAQMQTRVSETLGTILGGYGNAGNVRIEVRDNVVLTGEIDGIDSAILSDIGSGSVGNSGDVTIIGKSVLLSDGARISTSTFGEGKAGRILVQAQDSISLNNGNIFSTLEFGAVGRGGDISITANDLVLTEGSVISSSTLGQGNAGNILIQSQNSVLLTNSGIGSVVQPEAVGNGGEIKVQSDLFSLTNSRLSSSTSGGGDSGNIILENRRLVLRDGAAIAAATASEGKGGTLSVTASDSIELIGATADGQSSSGLTTQSEADGAAGNLIISTGRLILQDRAEIAVAAKGKGAAGNLEVTADSIRLNNGTMTGETAAGDRGNITLQSQDVQLRRTSSITTNAQGIATGGNITIDTGILAALENSDIRANAQEGSGGQVRINAQGIFGSLSRTREDLQTLLNTNDPNLLDPSLLPTSDITAISQQGGPQSQGSVQLITPDVDPSSGLIELPQTIVDPDALIAQNPCTLGKGSEFTVTGRGGLPPNPSEALSSRTVRVSLVEPTQASTTGSNTAMSVRSPRPDSLPIVPAQGWILNEKGQLVFTAYDPTGTGSNRLGRNPPTCPAR